MDLNVGCDAMTSLTSSVPEIEFWFEFASNYSYLSVMRIEGEAKRHGVRILWRPFLLGPIFRDLGMETSPFVLQKEKGVYVWQDMERQCRKYGLRWKRPSTFPRLSVLAARVAALGAEQPWMADYCRRVMELNFALDKDINSLAFYLSSSAVHNPVHNRFLVINSQPGINRLDLSADFLTTHPKCGE